LTDFVVLDKKTVCNHSSEEQQGELLDQIDHQVRTAANYVEQGNQEVQKAIKYQKSVCKK
jgi:t-SNARE complex subunit (syntaxin)